MDAYAAIISNNMNIVMKFLTSVTIVLSLPDDYCQHLWNERGTSFSAFTLCLYRYLCGVTLGLGGIVAYALYRWNMF